MTALLTIPEFAHEIRMSVSWVKKAITRKEIAVVKMGGCIRIRATEAVLILDGTARIDLDEVLAERTGYAASLHDDIGNNF